MKLYIILFSIIITLGGCQDYPEGVKATLKLAGNNKGELKKVLNYYQSREKDSLKYMAACYLIDNMKWHTSSQCCDVDSMYFKINKKLELLYEQYASRLSDEYLFDSRTYSQIYNASQITKVLIADIPLDTPQVNYATRYDPQVISSDFLIKHIDNAFYVWNNSSYAKFLTFDEFKEYILPYRSVVEYPYYNNGDELYHMFNKWLSKSTTKTFQGYMGRYQQYVNSIKTLWSYWDQKSQIGLFDLFLGYKGDCMVIANNNCNVMRANGFPMVVHHNTAYRAHTGRHYYCAFLDSTRVWHRFNAFSRSLDSIDPMNHLSLNLYENTFAAQQNSPFFLKNKDESLPDYFMSPCIKDITSSIFEVVSINIPLFKQIPNNIVFLCAFNNNPHGIVPSSWGIVSPNDSIIKCENVLLDVIYFPAYYTSNNQFVPIGEPFYLSLKDTISNTVSINYIYKKEDSLKTKYGTLRLTRKFPCKNYLIKRYKEMVGGRFEAANKRDFSDATLLYEITVPPSPFLQEFVLTNKKSFKYYRYVPSKESKYSYMANIELLVKKNNVHGRYDNITPLPILCKEDIDKPSLANLYVKAMANSNRYNPAFDGKMDIVSYNKIDSIELQYPECVERIRFVPLNARNNITPKHIYQLLYWDNGWKTIGSKMARYNYIEFNNVPLNKIYWLRDITEGKEELPFFYENNKQLFIYYDTIINRHINTYPLE